MHLLLLLHSFSFSRDKQGCSKLSESANWEIVLSFPVLSVYEELLMFMYLHSVILLTKT